MIGRNILITIQTYDLDLDITIGYRDIWSRGKISLLERPKSMLVVYWLKGIEFELLKVIC